MRTSKKYATETGAWPGAGWVGRQGGWGYVRSFVLVFVLDFPFGHLRAGLIVRSVFPLRRNEVKRDDGGGGRPVAHPSASIHAIMQVPPNEGRYHHSNAEPHGRLLTK